MSIAESPAAPPRAAGFACAHCGLEVPPGLVEESAERQFCCHGCRAVYAVIHEHGLERYYAYRSEAEDEPQPARPTGRSYAELDDPGFQARACWTTSDGLTATELFLEGVRRGVAFVPGPFFFSAGGTASAAAVRGLRLSYSALGPAALRHGVELLAEALHSLQGNGRARAETVVY